MLKAVLAATGMMMAAAASAAPVEHYGRPALEGQALPFSDAVRVGDMLYLSGQLGLVDGKVPADFAVEAEQVMDNIGAILKARGLTHDDLVKCTVMLDDMANWPAFNKIYMPYFKPGRMPARSAFGAKGLALGAHVEVECWAYAGTK